MRQEPSPFCGSSSANHALIAALQRRDEQYLLSEGETPPTGQALRQALLEPCPATCIEDAEVRLFSGEIPTDSRVKFLPMERLISPEEKPHIEQALHNVLKSGQFTSGPYLSAFEDAIARFTGLRHALSAASGTDAILAGLLALGVCVGDEVIIPANSFAATENAVFMASATPILADVGADHTLDPDSVEQLVTPRTKAILPVHLYGKMADMERLRQVADRHGLFVLEDACQCIGAKGMGRFGHLAALSFNPFKNFSVCGKAGALLTDDANLADRCRMYLYHGFDPGLKNVKGQPYGLNARMDNIQAAVGLARIPFLGLRNFKRLCLANRYHRLLDPLIRNRLIAVSPITEDHVWHLYGIELLTQSRDAVRREMLESFGVETDIYYPVLTHQYQTPLHQKLYGRTRLPRTEETAARILHLPLHPGMTLAEQDHVANALQAVLGPFEKDHA